MVVPLGISHLRSPPRPHVSSLPGMTKLANKIAETFAKGLASLRPAPWRVTPDGIRQDGTPPQDGESMLLRLESERGSLVVLLSLDRQSLSAVLEVAMGGTGAEPAFEMGERPLSKIETAILALSQAALAQRLTAAMSEFTGRSFSCFPDASDVELDRSGEFAHFRFVSNIFTYSGEINLSFSRNELEMQLADASAGSDSESATLGRKSMQDELGKAEITLTVTLGEEVLAVDVLAGLQLGALVELSSLADAPVTLWSGGVPAFEATLARAGERYAVKITSTNS